MNELQDGRRENVDLQGVFTLNASKRLFQKAFDEANVFYYFLLAVAAEFAVKIIKTVIVELD